MQLLLTAGQFLHCLHLSYLFLYTLTVFILTFIDHDQRILDCAVTIINLNCITENVIFALKNTRDMFSFYKQQ